MITTGEGVAPVPPRLRQPEPALLFDGRAARLRTLAPGHAAEDWLLLLSRIAAGQASAVREVPVEPARAAGEGPPLASARAARGGGWLRMLGIVLAAAKAPGLPAEAIDAVRRLSEAGASDLERVAEGVLACDVPADRLACAPFVGAALQAWFAALAARLDPAAVKPAAADACPVCGSPPVAGTVQKATRFQYLSCSLCGAEWNVPRLRCATCGSDAGLAYFHVEGDDGAKAEACSGCRTYLKLFDEEKRPGADAAADDAATLALDVLMAEEGFGRAGVNLYVSAAAAPP